VEAIQQFSVKAPAVVVSIAGMASVKSTGSAVQITVLFDAAVITKSLENGDADDPCAAISEKLARLLIDNSYGLDWADAAEDMDARNVYTTKIGAQSVNVWVMKWAQAVTVNKMTEAEFDALVETYERTGFTGGINWYRNFTRNWHASEGLEHRVRQPSLMIMAEKDAVLPPSAADGMENLIPDLEKQLVLGSGHWTQQEEPEQVNRLILDWLDRRFPK
jgi:pimeloyl-ACP methyl ester carboxylesterase